MAAGIDPDGEPLGVLLVGLAQSQDEFRREIAKAVQDFTAKRESVLTPQERSELINHTANRVAHLAERALTALSPTIKLGATWRMIAGAIAVFGLGTGFGLWAMHEEVAVANRRADTIESHIHETETALKAAFSGGQADAAAWLKLMSWNNADAALRNVRARQ